MQSRRLILGCVLLAILFGFAVHYGANVDTQERYPDNEDVATTYDSHVGQTVRISGTVRTTSANGSSGERAGGPGGADGSMTVTLRQYESFGPVTVQGAERTAPPGGTVQVIGTLEPDRAVTAQRVLPVNARSWSEPYKYAVSVVGAALVLVAFVREWRVDVERLAFEVRDDG